MDVVDVGRNGKVNAQYNVAAAGSVPTRIAAIQRRKMFESFLAFGPAPDDLILDIGATSDRSYSHSNYLEAWYPHKAMLTAAGIDAGAAFLETAYPGVRFVLADGRDLPFADGSFDYVHSSAVIEHVGGGEQQFAFLSEALRVARKGVFLTTPNRWFPVEFHTVLPLVHWLPPAQFRRVLRMLGLNFFATEETLNLLTAAQLRRMIKRLGAEGDVGGVRLAGWTSNLIVTLNKRPSGAAGTRAALGGVDRVFADQPL
jgi:hypothetical protein